MFEKLFEPDYGEVAPEVHIDEPLPDVFAGVSPDIPRRRFQTETAADINMLLRRCNCYDTMMEVPTRNFKKECEGRTVTLRVYYPLTDGKHPVMVFYHGGGFSLHNPEVFDSVTRYIARFGEIIVISVDYALAPENKFPKGLHDAYAGLEWAAEHAEELGGDRSRLSVCGDSAGGNLAAAVSLMARDKKGPQLQKQILIYPVTVHHLEERTRSEIRYGNGYFLQYDSTADTLGGLFERPEDKYLSYASPLLAESAENLPEACFISAECDPLLDQGLMYAKKLKDAGVKVEYSIYKGMLHGFLNLTYGETFKALNRICDFVNNN